MVDHDFDGAAGFDITADLLEDARWMRRMMDDTEGKDEIVSLVGERLEEILGVGMDEADPILQTKDGCSPPGNLQRMVGKINGCNQGPMACKIDGVGADPAANLQNLLVPPAFELNERQDMGSDEVFPGFDLVKVFLRPDLLWRIPDVARASVPVAANCLYWNRFKWV